MGGRSRGFKPPTRLRPGGSRGVPRYEVIDTFPAFRRFWRDARRLPIDQQLEAWGRDYLGPWPELRRKQIANYADDRVDWKAVARRRIFPALDRRLPRMRKVRDALRRAIPVAVRRCQARWGLDFPVLFVIHVGIGCGAGWATTYRRTPAVLFGVENAAELAWTDPATVVALVEHELAHLLHARWRRRAGLGGLEDHRGPWWQLYEEGWATRCELLLGSSGLHHAKGRTSDWLGWCRANRARLASRFLRAVSARATTRRFFGSWYSIDGYIETGYFLGSEVTREWEARSSLHQIALWTPDQVRRRARASLRRMASGRRADGSRARAAVRARKERDGEEPHVGDPGFHADGARPRSGH